MNKLFLILVFFFHNSLFSQLDSCTNSVTDIYNNIISNIANNFPAPPELSIIETKNNPAYISKGTIYIDLRLVELFCNQENFESKIAYVLSHELAHHYLYHSWASKTGLAYSNSLGEFIEDNSNQYSEKQRKLDESQADIFGGFFSQISGYQALSHGAETLKSIYKEYKVPEKMFGYPSLRERVDILDSNISKSNDLAKIFELGNLSLAIGKLDMARNCFKEILNNNFISREIYNNLGLSYLLNAIEIADSSISKFSYPIYIEQNTRAEIQPTRSLSDNPIKDLKEAIKYFENANRLDSDFEPAKVNILTSKLILNQIENTLSKNFFKDLEESSLSDKLKLNDLMVIYYLFNDKARKAAKLASKGSVVSFFNTGIKLSKKDVMFSEKLPSYQKVNFDDFIFGLDKPNKSIIYGNLKINIKKENTHSVYDFNLKEKSIVIEVNDLEYIDQFKNLNIKFDSVSLISNFTYMRNKEEKVVFKYSKNKLVSIIFYQ
tara:strand:- start:5845 stop:7320 length:1476 start_codon:yes stop_codon:yes gene_type:complete